jgi:hypothetical protein
MLSADGTYNYHSFKYLSEQGNGIEFCIVPGIWNRKIYPIFFLRPFLIPEKVGVNQIRHSIRYKELA